MKMQVVFEDSPSDLVSDDYILRQEVWQQDQLKRFSDELLKNRTIDHPDAGKIENEKWSIFVRHDGKEAVNHICYLTRIDQPILSSFAKVLLNTNSKALEDQPQKLKRLMILTHDLHAVSIGKADEYTDPEWYASLMDSIQRELFLKTIEDIKTGIPSKNYKTKPNGCFSIDINEPNLAYGVHIKCEAKWV